MPWPVGNYTAQGGVQVVINYHLHGQLCNNTLWFTRGGELGEIDWPAELLALAQAIVECAVTHLLPGLSSQATFDNVTATLMSATDKIQHVEPFPANSAGALGESLPVQSAATVTFYTPYSGKQRRGGNRVAGIPEANHAQSILSGVPIAAIAAFYACLLTKFKFDVGTFDFDWIVYSRKAGFSAPSTYNFGLDAIAPVTQVITRTVVGSQNTRKLGRGQ